MDIKNTDKQHKTTDISKYPQDTKVIQQMYGPTKTKKRRQI